MSGTIKLLVFTVAWVRVNFSDFSGQPNQSHSYTECSRVRSDLCTEPIHEEQHLILSPCQENKLILNISQLWKVYGSSCVKKYLLLLMKGSATRAAMLHRCRFVISASCVTPQASLSMDEAARQTSSHSLSSASSASATVRRPGSSQRQHRRTGSVGTVSEHEVTRHLLLSRFYTSIKWALDIVISTNVWNDLRHRFFSTSIYSVCLFIEMSLNLSNLGPKQELATSLCSSKQALSCF